MNENYYWCVKNAFIEHFFKKQHFSSKFAYLIFPKLAKQIAGIDIVKLKNAFTNRCLRDRIKPAHYERENRFVYIGMTFNTFALKSIYELTQDKNIKNWLEDLCIANMFVRYDRDFKKGELRKLSQIFIDADEFYKIILEKIIALGCHENVNFLSIDKAIEILRNARITKDKKAYKLSDHFIQTVRYFPSTKHLLAYKKTRSEVAKHSVFTDFFANKEFRDELNKFMTFVVHKKAYKNQVALGAYKKLICIFCNREVYELYKQENPFVALDVLYSNAPPSIVNKVRLKKITYEFSAKPENQLIQLLNNEANHFTDQSYKRIIFLMDRLFQKSLDFDPKKFLKDTLLKDLHISDKLEKLYFFKNSSGFLHSSIKTSRNLRDELEDFYNELCLEISNIDINNFKKYKDEIRELIYKTRNLSKIFFKKYPNETFNLMWDAREFHDSGKVVHEYSEQAVNKALQHKINRQNEMDYISDSDKYFIESILRFYHEKYEPDFCYGSKKYQTIIKKSAPNIQNKLFTQAESFFKGNNLNDSQGFNSFKNILLVLFGACQEESEKYLNKNIQTIFYSNFLEFLKENEVNIINNENYRDLVLKLSSKVNDAKANSILDLNFKNKFFKYFDDLVIKIIYENKIPLDKFWELGIQRSKFEIIGWSLHLEKGNPVNADQEAALNRMPLTQDMYSLCKKFNAPYWATQLNLFEKLM